MLIPNGDGCIYLGLPLGKKEFIEEFVDNKWKSVEKSFYSLYGMGCKPKRTNPHLIAFLYKQYCQSIFRSCLDNLFISERQLNELELRQNMLLKQTLGIKKYGRVKPMNECLKVESIRQIYFKHKIFFLQQLKANSLCRE